MINHRCAPALLAALMFTLLSAFIVRSSALTFAQDATAPITTAPPELAPLDEAWYGAWIGVAISPAPAAANTAAAPEMPVSITVTRGDTHPIIAITVVPSLQTMSSLPDARSPSR